MSNVLKQIAEHQKKHRVKDDKLRILEAQFAESQKREAELQNHKRAVLRILEVIKGDPATSVIEQVIALREALEHIRDGHHTGADDGYYWNATECRAIAKQALAAKESNERT